MNIRCFQRIFFAALPPLAPLQLPSPMETHLWYIMPGEVKSVALLNQYSELLQPCERENVNRMGGDQPKKRALLVRALVRTTIARYRWSGEMKTTSAHHPCISISHTSSMIACGVTVYVPIGIDVEEKQRRIKNNVIAFAQRYFSPYEVKLLTALSDPEVQRQEFIKLWTLKEAYVKALEKDFQLCLSRPLLFDLGLQLYRTFILLEIQFLRL